MDVNKAMVVEDNAMDVFMSGPFLQWVSLRNRVFHRLMAIAYKSSTYLHF